MKAKSARLPVRVAEVLAQSLLARGVRGRPSEFRRKEGEATEDRGTFSAP